LGGKEKQRKKKEEDNQKEKSRPYSGGRCPWTKILGEVFKRDENFLDLRKLPEMCGTKRVEKRDVLKGLQGWEEKSLIPREGI